MTDLWFVQRFRVNGASPESSYLDTMLDGFEHELVRLGIGNGRLRNSIRRGEVGNAKFIELSFWLPTITYAIRLSAVQTGEEIDFTYEGTWYYANHMLYFWKPICFAMLPHVLAFIVCFFWFPIFSLALGCLSYLYFFNGLLSRKLTNRGMLPIDEAMVNHISWEIEESRQIFGVALAEMNLRISNGKEFTSSSIPSAPQNKQSGRFEVE